MTELELRKAVATWGDKYLGIKEGSSEHKAILKVFNDSKLCKRYTMTTKDAWCQTFASASGIANGLSDIIPVECSCAQAIKLWQKLGRWEENDAYVPQVGDYLYYDWDDNGVGDNTGNPDHVGIVYSVNGSKMTIIEGNYSNTVKKRTLSINGKYIRGYGLPNYASKTTATISEPKKTTSNTTATTSKTSGVEAAQSKDKSVSKGKTFTTTANLNMRKGAGTSKARIKVLNKGSKVTWYGYYTSVSGVKWYYVVDSTGTVGFVSSQYLK